jgi:hypothetical protein
LCDVCLAVVAALGPNHAAITALEGKVEAVRTAMSASVGLMMTDLAAEATGGSNAAAADSTKDLASEVAVTQQTASDAVNAAVASHQEALMVSASSSRVACSSYGIMRGQVGEPLYTHEQSTTS